MREGSIQAMRSVNVGCVRMTERHFVNDPPLPSEVKAARDDIDAAIALAAKDVPLRTAQTLVALAGSATTVAGVGSWPLGVRPRSDPSGENLRG